MLENAIIKVYWKYKGKEYEKVIETDLSDDEIETECDLEDLLNDKYHMDRVIGVEIESAIIDERADDDDFDEFVEEFENTVWCEVIESNEMENDNAHDYSYLKKEFI